MLYADAGIYLPESKATLVYSRLAKRLRKLNLESFQRLLRPRGRPRRRRRAAGDAVGADDQRDPFLPRAAPFRTSQGARPAGDAERRAPRRESAVVVGRVFERPGALFDRADPALARPQRRRARHQDIGHRHRSARRRGGKTRRLCRGRAGRRAARLAQAIFRFGPERGASGMGGRRRAQAIGFLPDAQSERGLADAGKIRRHLLPQRRHLLRRADPAEGVEQVRLDIGARRLALYRPFRTGDRPGGFAVRQRRRHRLSAQRRERPHEARSRSRSSTIRPPCAA